MRRLVAVAFSVLSLAGFLTIQTPAANADPNDRGDRTRNCVRGEICFQYLVGSTDCLRHFYNGAPNHEGDTFSCSSGSTPRLMDNIEGYWNRDTACPVKMWDVDGAGGWFVYKTIYQSQTAGYRDIHPPDNPNGNSSGRNRNNGHTRC